MGTDSEIALFANRCGPMEKIEISYQEKIVKPKRCWLQRAMDILKGEAMTFVVWANETVYP